jgi:hypothetical protein
MSEIVSNFELIGVVQDLIVFITKEKMTVIQIKINYRQTNHHSILKIARLLDEMISFILKFKRIL